MPEPRFQESKAEFCKELIAAREYKKMDMNRVAERTKIGADYLEKLESGEWDFLPHSYVRAFLRTYAQTVGMDTAQVLNRFDQLMGIPPTPEPGIGFPEPMETKRSEAETSEEGPKFALADEQTANRNFKRYPSMVLFGGGLLVVAIAVYFFVIAPKSGEHREGLKEIPFEEVVRENRIVVDSDTSVHDSLSNPEGPGDAGAMPGGETGTDSIPGSMEQQTATRNETGMSLTLRAVVSQACYFKLITDDGTAPVLDTTLPAGTVRIFTADSLFRIVIGNTSAVQLTLNGRQLSDINRLGRVATMTIDRRGIREILPGNRELNSTE